MNYLRGAMAEQLPWFNEDPEIEERRKLWVRSRWETEAEHRERIVSFLVKQILKKEVKSGSK